MALHAEAASQALPSHLKARLRVVKATKDADNSAKHILYWMRAGLCLRGHENPALDSAVFCANRMKLPLTILLHVEDGYAHATARRQLFLLEGARETATELVAKFKSNASTSVVVDVDQRNASRCLEHRLPKLLDTAAVVIAEESFCSPFIAGWQELRRIAAVKGVPIWALDCGSIVPSASVNPKDCTRAFAYEKATSRAHKECMDAPWHDLELESGSAAYEGGDALTSNVDLGNVCNADLEEVLLATNVDHSVKPVPSTPGGSSEGYSRWERWVTNGGLKTYAKRRNDALDIQGVSRMSAYINTGMVCPWRLAREANATGGSGLGKWLNEFLAWRGMSYGFCYHYWSTVEAMSPQPSLSLLPDWAQRTLMQHARDPRKSLTRDELAVGKTGDRGWDGMQAYLRETGELHNNARMGWGAAIVKWTASPQEALERLVDLNNTFALDGHAPPSYGGLLSSLGLFAGQNQNGDAPIYGRVKAAQVKGKYWAMANTISEALAYPGTEETKTRIAPYSNLKDIDSIGDDFSPVDTTSSVFAPKKRWKRTDRLMGS